MQTLKRLIKEFPEFIGLPLSLLAFFIAPPLLRMMDETAAPLDAGFLHGIVYASIVLLALNFIVFIGIRLNFPSVYNFYKNQLLNPNSSLTPIHLLCVLCFYFFVYSLVFVSILWQV